VATELPYVMGALSVTKQFYSASSLWCCRPAWEQVWICPLGVGHLRRFANLTKFHSMLDFANALPGIGKQVERDLRRHGLPREKVVAAVVRLLETTFIRVGNAKENSSFGLTTLRGAM
jgi:DNA topoisomerase I